MHDATAFDGGKPCPFCGGEPMMQKSRRWPADSNNAVNGYVVICVESDCLIFRADNKYYLTEQEAIQKWNERTEPPVGAACLKPPERLSPLSGMIAERHRDCWRKIECCGH
ncbi:MAG: Lar family restriction alleviation protein [Christensenellales bacterium]